jgi:restriction system protein
MAIPDYQSVMLPLLRFASDRQEHRFRQAIESLAEEFNLSDDERKQLLPSGRKATFDDRVSWASTYLKKAGLLKSTRRGYFQITDRGLEVLKQPPARITNEFLEQFPEFVEFKTRRKKPKVQLPEDEEEQTPEGAIESAYQRLNEDLAADLLETVMECSPTFFERLVVDLLVKMGYGGTRKEAGQAIGRTSDEGIDGIINEDRMGLDVVYIQAKKWDNTVVGRPEIQKFAGALQGQRARKGIFITTSSFSKAAYDYVSRIDSKIVLIDGELLSQLMIDYNVGVAPVASYELKRIDSDYFLEE